MKEKGERKKEYNSIYVWERQCINIYQYDNMCQGTFIHANRYINKSTAWWFSGHLHNFVQKDKNLKSFSLSTVCLVWLIHI